MSKTYPPAPSIVQDLELWITKEVVEHGYNLAVRAGRVVQVRGREGWNQVVCCGCLRDQQERRR